MKKFVAFLAIMLIATITIGCSCGPNPNDVGLVIRSPLSSYSAPRVVPTGYGVQVPQAPAMYQMQLVPQVAAPQYAAPQYCPPQVPAIQYAPPPVPQAPKPEASDPCVPQPGGEPVAVAEAVDDDVEAMRRVDD